MNPPKNSKAIPSKFSGLLDQARMREEPVITETPEPEISQIQAPLKTARRSEIRNSPSDTPKEQSEYTKEFSERPADVTPQRGRGKRSDPDFTQITAYIRVETHQDVKTALLREAIERGRAGERGAKPREISEIVEQVLRLWLEEEGKSI